MKSKLVLTEESKAALESDIATRDKWAAALRSGKYTQNWGSMCDPNVPNSACCLHVLEVECNGLSWEAGSHIGYPSSVYERGFSQGSPVHFSGLLAEKLTAIDGGYGCYLPVKPDQWNDALGLTFNQIADLLEHGEVEFEEHDDA